MHENMNDSTNSPEQMLEDGSGMQNLIPNRPPVIVKGGSFQSESGSEGEIGSAQEDNDESE